MSEEEVDPADVSLFRQAMRTLDTVPDKDGGEGRAQRPQRTGLRRRRPPRARSLDVDDSLDLHHSRVEEALVALDRFVRAGVARRARTLVVITGKGHHSPGGTSVIKGAVERWILRHGKRLIEAYSEAPARYGGSGAFVLYLRRD